MAYQVIIKSKAEKNLNKIPEQYRVKIIAALDSLVVEPFMGKKLSGKKKGLYSVHVWPYRIIYQIHDRELVVLVINIGHR